MTKNVEKRRAELLEFMRVQYAAYEAMLRRLDALYDVAEGCLEDIGDDIFFLEHGKHRAKRTRSLHGTVQ